MVRIVGNDGFDRISRIDAKSIEEALQSLPALVEAQGRTTIEQFVKIEIEEVNSMEW
jgi:hypothetical protein